MVDFFFRALLPAVKAPSAPQRLQLFFYSWTTRGSASSWSSPAPPAKNTFASTNRSAITSASAQRERSTASTARSRFTSKTSRLDRIYLDMSGALRGSSEQLFICLQIKRFILQAHDEICPKYPMICEGCAKKKIPREKVNLWRKCGEYGNVSSCAAA